MIVIIVATKIVLVSVCVPVRWAVAGTDERHGGVVGAIPAAGAGQRYLVVEVVAARTAAVAVAIITITVSIGVQTPTWGSRRPRARG